MKIFIASFLLTFSSQAVDFTKEIKPIFDEHCSKCHGEKKQKSEFRLDVRSSILSGGDLGEPGVVPGEPEKSTIYKLISLEEDHDDIMPPKGDPLSKEQIQLIAQWIKEGAKMPELKTVKEEQLWSHQPVVKPVVPKHSENPVDAFLQAKLKEKGLLFNEEADPVTLLRRVQVILTGFLPTSEESARFLKSWNEDSTKAYKEKVEELLASPHYGERWAQHWLDAIRWSETSGSESNLYRKYAWRYRDYVVSSFNKDKPYSNFIIDQLAGDQTGFPRATGFLVSGPHVPPATVGQEPDAVLQARYDRLDQIMQTLGASIMGQTLSCARCHSHKFDPIKINDYYSILANFQGTEFGIRVPELGDNNPSVKNGKIIMSKINKIRSGLKGQVWLEDWRDHNEVHLANKKIKGFRLTFNPKKVFIDEIEVFDSNNKNIIKEAKLSSNLQGNRAEVAKLSDGEIGGFYALRGEAPDKEKGQVIILFDEARSIHHYTFSSDRKVKKNTDYEIRNNKNTRMVSQQIEILTENGEWKTLVKNSNQLKLNGPIQELIEDYLLEGPQHEFIGKFIEPVKSHVLLRGVPNTPGVEVYPGTLSSISPSLGMNNSTPEGVRRMEFAKWLASKENPLTARVMVNRLWHHTFGTGIVSTLSDFGNAGAEPSHPELLDYLASEFMENKWSVKHILRLYLNSRAFKQSSRPIEEALKIDADARLLWRFPPRRTEAEVIRDSVLKLSSSLIPDVGGISYRIHNTKKRYALWQVVDNHSQSTWRRMIYQERMRGVDDRMFTAFDFPDCGQVLSKRPSSTTPLQALNLMNSKFIDTQCEILAAKFHSSNKAESVKQLFLALYNRMPTAEELDTSVKILETENLKILCRAMINSNEFVFIQ
ncbi:MAG: PSD1 and planctomycete cytochrome C domain-containing protein [Lentisphaeraceae bacterium]|nr:PSD1 and planctomycete cytochrome C domain-containing protein [Lentisphaeraceae bacterium]